MKKSRILSMIMAIGLLFTSCANNSSTSQSSKQITEGEIKSDKIERLVIGTAMGVEKASRSDYYFDVLSGTLSQLAPVAIAENGTFKPMLTDFSTKDSKTWSFKINNDYKWSDGTPVTTEDIKFTIEYLDKEDIGKYLSMYESINIINEKEIEMVLKSPNVRYLSNLTTLRIIPQHIYKDIQRRENATEIQTSISSGVYVYSKFNSDAGTLEFVKNPYYPNNTAKVENVIFKLFGNEDTMYMALKSGEIDMVYTYAGGVSQGQLPTLENNKNITLIPIKDTSNTAVLVFNNTFTPYDNALIRKAVSKAIDYEKIRELFGTSHSTPSTEGFVPMGNLGYIDTPINKRDINTAKALLKEAGGIDTDNDGILELNATPLIMEILIRNDKPIYLRYGELLKENLLDVGIKVNMVETDTAQFRTITEKEHTNQSIITKFTAFGMGMGAGMGTSYLDARLSTNGQAQIVDTEFHNIVDRLSSATSQEEYIKAAEDCQKYYAKTMPAIALYWDSYITPHKSNLNGFIIDGTFGLLNMETWFNITRLS